MERIDLFLVRAGKAESRTKAQSLIAEGAVLKNGKTVTKPSEKVSMEDTVVVLENNTSRYVGRGGHKLFKALVDFEISPLGKTALDIGASTGGFTDCLLQEGARHVYAVDVGEGQLAERLLRDARVTAIEHYNARFLKRSDFPEEIDLVVMDVSFVSQTVILPALSELLSPGKECITLIKPQFEVGPADVGKGGIVRSERARMAAVRRVTETAIFFGFDVRGVIDSPITGGDGNREYLAYFVKRGALNGDQSALNRCF